MENRFIEKPARWAARPLNGFMMNRWASLGASVAGGGICCAADSSLRRALASASGSWDRYAPDSSAWYSRERDTAIWIGAMVVSGGLGVAFWGGWAAVPFFWLAGPTVTALRWSMLTWNAAMDTGAAYLGERVQISLAILAVRQDP